jgi:D-glycero-beta-D-manno-heptose-7-phosphate kinase
MLAKNDISKLFEKFKQLNILIIGDVMLDSYLWGKVDRISPEAPVPIVSVLKRENRLGGAANVAVNVKAMGAKPIICSVIGNDQRGVDFTDLLKKLKLSDAGIIKSDKRITTTKFRVMGNNAHILRVDEEIDSKISKKDFDRLYKQIEKLVKKDKIGAIIFEDYDKGIIDKRLIDKVVELAKSNNIFVAVDPKRRNFSDYKGVTLFKPNLKELNEGLKIDIESTNLEEIQNAVNVLHLKQNINIVLLTLASEGVYVSEKTTVHSPQTTDNRRNRKYSGLKQQMTIKKFIPAHKRTIADVSGAGDTVISVATLCLAAGLSATDTAQIANLAGGLVCEKVGAVPINREILKEAIFTDCLLTPDR